MRQAILAPAFAVALLAASPAKAAEIFGGVLAHDVDSPLTAGGLEHGVDFQLGFRGGRIGALGFVGSPSPYGFVSVHSGGETHLVAGGLSWQISPKRLLELVGDKDPDRARRAMEAMLKMRKIDIATIERAADGEATAGSEKTGEPVSAG